MKSNGSGSVVLTIIFLMATLLLIVRSVFHTGYLTNALVTDCIKSCQHQYTLEGLLSYAIAHAADNYQDLKEQLLQADSSLIVPIAEWPGAYSGEIHYLLENKNLRIEVTLLFAQGATQRAFAFMSANKDTFSINQWHFH